MAQYGSPPSGDNRGTIALILAVVSYFTCGLFLSIPAWLMANGVLATTSPADPQNGTANAARIIAMINVILAVIGVLLTVLWLVLFGGLAILGAAAGGGSY